jgi:hypothetical protein
MISVASVSGGCKSGRERPASQLVSIRGRAEAHIVIARPGRRTREAMGPPWDPDGTVVACRASHLNS